MEKRKEDSAFPGGYGRLIPIGGGRQYPTYQLCGELRKENCGVSAALREAALITQSWLVGRFGDAVPPALECLRDAEDPARPLPSLYYGESLSVYVLSRPKDEACEGRWTLQLTEPDPGLQNPDGSSVPPVPGRTITTNVEYRVVGGALHFGVKVVVNDTSRGEDLAAVIRPAIINRLADAGFALCDLPGQDQALSRTVGMLGAKKELQRMLRIWDDPDNYLPIVLMICVPEGDTAPAPREAALLLSGPGALRGGPGKGLTALPPLPKGALPPLPGGQAPGRAGKGEAIPEAYGAAGFASGGFGFYRVFGVKTALLPELEKALGQEFRPGELVLLEPKRWGGKLRRQRFAVAEKEQKARREKVKEQARTYLREKELPFGPVTFLASAHAELLKAQERELQRADEAREELKDSYQQQLLLSRRQLGDAQDRLAQQEQQHLKALAEKDRQNRKLMDRCREAEQKLAAGALAQKRLEELCAYVERCRFRPENGVDEGRIARWTEEQLRGRVVILPGAVDERNLRTRNVSMRELFDMLDWLGADFWETCFGGLSGEEADRRSIMKYGGKWQPLPAGEVTGNMFRSEYTVKYLGGTRFLDYHIKSGKDRKTLIRIYFFLDTERKQVVVGCLPDHLPTVSYNS